MVYCQRKVVDGVEIVFAMPLDMVPGLFEVTKETWFVRPKQVPEGAMPRYMRIPPCHQAATRGGANGMLDMALVETYPFGSQTVIIGHLYQRMPIARDALRPHLVWKEKDKVHFHISPSVLKINLLGQQ